MAVNTPGWSYATELGKFPCEGPKTVKVPLDFATDPIQIVDLSLIQSKGEFSAAQALYIDNSLNTSAIFIVCDVSYQTITCPPNGMIMMPILQPNPPKISFTSAGAFVVPVHFTNFFLPPMIWSPSAAPGGGGGGGITQVTVTDFSGASPVTIPANAARKWFLISNPVASGVSSFFTIAGGGAIELTLGGIYETGPAVPMGAIVITNAGGPIVAYEGI